MGTYYTPGTYLCEVVQQGFAEAKTGKPMIVLQVKVIAQMSQGPEGEEFENCLEMYDRTIRLVIDGSQDVTMDYVMRKLRFAGFEGDSFVNLNLVGKEIRCVCTRSEFNGKPTEQWDLALPMLESKPLAALDSSAARKLNALFGKRLKEGAKPKEQVPATATNEGPPPDDECPF